MGHQHHFLSRLDRVSAPHVELALSLYRDDALLKYVLENVRLPEAAERVAISLEHPERGPFLVVTRGGVFVTCLGAGMSAGDLPIITRGQLDGIAAKASVLRERLEKAVKLAGARGGMGKLLLRIQEASDELSREDLIAISALQPLYAGEFYAFYLSGAKDLLGAREILIPELRKSDRLKPQFRGALRTYWNTFWSVGHLAVLAAMEGRVVFERLDPKTAEDALGISYSWPAVRQGMLVGAVRGVWGAARIGKALLPAYKQGFDRANTDVSVLDSGMGLAAIGLRHTRLRAEVQKALAAGPTLAAGHPFAGLLQSIATALQKIVEVEGKEPGFTDEAQLGVGSDIAVKMGVGLPRGSPFRFERPEDVPADIAMTLPLIGMWPFMTSIETVLTMLTFLPWVARTAPENLYLPRDFLAAYRRPWEPEDTLQLLRPHRDHFMAKARARVRSRKPAGPSRGGPCPCGSGKKYKRCCGAAE